MHSHNRPVNCIPCAKRKVRCDKRQPCNHCSRRIGDECVYPSEQANRADRRLEVHSNRIHELEAYVRRLGGDPQRLSWSEVQKSSIDQSITESEIGNGAAGETTSYFHSQPEGKEDLLKNTKGRLVEHDEEVTYLQAPLWYSWDGAKKPTEESPLPADRTCMPRTTERSRHCFPTILDPIHAVDPDSLRTLCPSTEETKYLWKRFLDNVHPLVMIFFEWEIEMIISKSCQDSNSLSKEEQALVIGICFISTLSLSEDECMVSLHDTKPHLLDRFQKAVEGALLIAKFLVTSNRLVLQAFMLYLLVMRSRALPAAVFALTGIASRIAERMGLHHDGEVLGLTVLRSEERRRIWWQLQHMEAMIGYTIGCFPMTVYGDWDTRMPANIEDRDLHPDTRSLPSERHGLTTMSHCLWRYRMLQMERNTPSPNRSWMLMLSSPLPLKEKDVMLDNIEKAMGSQFLQYCEPLKPLHTLIQVGIRSFVLGARRVARQPASTGTKISQMTSDTREELLTICVKCLEYYIFGETNESLRGYKWQLENYFHWSEFVYIILEAHHRFEDHAVTELWSLVGKVYTIHPQLMTSVERPDVASVAQMTLTAWQKRHEYLRHQQQQLIVDSPSWIMDLQHSLELSSSVHVAHDKEQDVLPKASKFLPNDFDFDTIDWALWSKLEMDAS